MSQGSPTNEGDVGATPPPSARAASPPDLPFTFVMPAQWAAVPLDRTVDVPPPPPPKKPGMTVPRWLVAVVVAVIVLAGAIGFGLGASMRNDRGSSNASAPTGLNPSSNRATPIVPSPNSSVLALLIVRTADVPSPLGVQLLPDGNIVAGQPTLELCNGTFPSESLRTERLQVAAVDTKGDAVLSTEAVLYISPAAAMQAFSELTTVAASCADVPLASPVGDPTVTTLSGIAPDAAWPQTPTVDRLAYSLTATNQTGRSQNSVAVYLRRGRALLGVYFPMSDGAQASIVGQTTIPDIVTLFANRLARVPDSVANG